MHDVAGDVEPTTLQDRQRRRWALGAVVVGLLLTMGVAAFFALQGPDDTAANEGDEGTSTTQRQTQDADATEGADGQLKQVGTEPPPQVSNVEIGPGVAPVDSDDVGSLAEAPVTDEVEKAELAQIDDQVAEANEVVEQEARQMDEALTAYQETQAEEVAEFDDADEVPLPDEGVLDDLESDAADLNAELNETLEGLQTP